MRSYAEGFVLSSELDSAGTMLDTKNKFCDLKAMLDSNRESIKMDAMKRIINMVARGKDVSELFPAVVKNVAVKNLELKKLVYVYLVRYAEEQQDLALLSISTFQRALKDPNQLIRASALRVLSSIRVLMISPVMLLALKDSVRDMSAYVRKVAAHAIPKLYSLDSSLHADLIECIDYLLADKRTLVLGSAVYAFEQICPNRLDLLHRHFRPLCRALVDVDEWGQITMIGLLTRYARTQFISPLSDDDGKEPLLDPDHNLLIQSTKPLLQSRNCAVVMAAAQLLYYIAPFSYHSLIPRALIRLLRGTNEVQYVVLMNISSICQGQNLNNTQNDAKFYPNKNLFEPFLKSFFIRSSDSISVKRLKLHILTLLASDANAQLVIRELQAYLQTSDIAESAVEAIGRCALKVSSASETCLNCLVNLIRSSREQIVCSAVVVLKNLLHPEAPLLLLKKLARLIDSVKTPTARACLIWLVFTHFDKVVTLAPDLLRKIAQTYSNEDDAVKLQALNLAAKLWASNDEYRKGKLAALINYVFQLARYDKSYDIRDRCRFLRNFLFSGKIATFPIEIFLAEKPTPIHQNQFAGRERFQLGTLSNLLNQKCMGYKSLPDFPAEQPDPSIRRTAYPLNDDELSIDKTKENLLVENAVELLTDEDDDEEEEEEEEGEEECDEEDEEDEEAEDDEFEQTEEDEEEVLDETNQIIENEYEKMEGENSLELEPACSTDSSINLNEEKLKKRRDIFDFDEKATAVKNMPNGSTNTNSTTLDMLLDLDFNNFPSSNNVISSFSRSPAQFVSEDYFTLLTPIQTNGLTVEGRFSRSPCLFSNSMVCTELRVFFRSCLPELKETDVNIEPIKCPDVKTSSTINLYGLRENERRTAILGIDFNDACWTSDWIVKWNNRRCTFQLSAPFGEQLEAIEMDGTTFSHHQSQLVGMNQVRRKLKKWMESFTARDLYKICNCRQVQGLKWCFASQTISKKSLVLISISETDGAYYIVLNSENITFASILAKEIGESLENIF